MFEPVRLVDFEMAVAGLGLVVLSPARRRPGRRRTGLADTVDALRLETCPRSVYFIWFRYAVLRKDGFSDSHLCSAGLVGGGSGLLLGKATSREHRKHWGK